MKIHQIFTDNQLRNFTYIIELNDKSAYVVDPWSAEAIGLFLTDKQLVLKAIINTHEHWDHTHGNQELVDSYGCEVWAHALGKGKIPAQSRYLQPDEKINLDKNTVIQVLDTPGHCQAHLCFIIYCEDNAHAIFTGDILFNAGVGNCHDGDVEDLYDTISEKIATLPDEIRILPGHEYLENNLKFTLNREPSNSHAQQWLDKFYQSDVHNLPLITTLSDEKDINCFLRLHKQEIIQNLSCEPDEKEVFIALRTLRNSW